jgi:hypothetical protein
MEVTCSGRTKIVSACLPSCIAASNDPVGDCKGKGYFCSTIGVLQSKYNEKATSRGTNVVTYYGVCKTKDQKFCQG